MKYLSKITTVFLVIFLQFASSGIEIRHVRPDSQEALEFEQIANMDSLRTFYSEDYKHTFLVVKINGEEYSKFASRGKFSESLGVSTPFNPHKGSLANEIAKKLHENGIKFDISNVEIQVLSAQKDISMVKRTIERLENEVRRAEESFKDPRKLVVPPKTFNEEENMDREELIYDNLNGALVKRAIKKLESAKSTLRGKKKKYDKLRETSERLKDSFNWEANLVHLTKCLHAETKGVYDILKGIEDGNIHTKPREIKIYGNNDPCFQCQELLQKFADFIDEHFFEDKTPTKIIYYSKNKFHGACLLPQASLEPTQEVVKEVLWHGRVEKLVSTVVPDIFSGWASSRKSEDCGKILAFTFTGKKGGTGSKVTLF